MSDRSEKRRDAAEECCKAIRTMVSKRVVDQTSDDGKLLMSWLLRWMSLSGKEKYDPPRPCGRGGMKEKPE